MNGPGIVEHRHPDGTVVRGVFVPAGGAAARAADALVRLIAVRPGELRADPVLSPLGRLLLEVERQGPTVAGSDVGTGCSCGARRWLTPEEAAGVAEVSARAIRKRAARGRYPGAMRTSGGQWLIPADEIEPERAPDAPEHNEAA